MEGHPDASAPFAGEVVTNPSETHLLQIQTPVEIDRICPICNQQFPYGEFDEHLKMHVQPQTFHITDVVNEQVLTHLMQGNFPHIVTITDTGNIHGVVQTLGPHQVLTDASALGHTQILLQTSESPVQNPSSSEVKEVERNLSDAAQTQVVLHAIEDMPVKYTDNTNSVSSGEEALPRERKPRLRSLYKCGVCEYTSKYSTDLIRHTHTHGGRVQFQCNGVSFTVVGEPGPTKILNAKTSKKQYECHICQRNFSRSLILKAHMRVHSGGMKFTCKTCGKQFPLQSYLTRHKRMHYNDAVYPCVNCTETFISQRLLTAHRLSKHNEKAPQCGLCGKYFPAEMELMKHVKMTHPCSNNFQCLDCNKKFKSPSHLTRHQRMHYCEKKLQCSTCQKQFKSLMSLRRHKEIHREWIKCNKCEKQFHCQNLYQRHKKLHKMGHHYKCSVCEKSFSEKKLFMKHKLQHSSASAPQTAECEKKPESDNLPTVQDKRATPKEKPFPCPKCDKKFRTQVMLDSHVEVHDHGTEAPCLFCNKSFCRTDILARHMKTKHMDSARKCPICDKDFPSSDHFNRHMRTHTGEKPYQCDVCEKRFSQAANLQTHKRTHTGEKPFECHICGKRFTNARNHRTHIVKQH